MRTLKEAFLMIGAIMLLIIYAPFIGMIARKLERENRK